MTNTFLKYLTFFLCIILLPLTVRSKENIGIGKREGRTGNRTSEACLPATSTAQLDINNVRALLQNGGDMWWDLVANPRYEVPKVDNPANARHSLFAGSVWIGGLDASGTLRVAAMTYRQSGNDFFPGPLRADGSADRDVCSKWDKHFKVTRAEIARFLSEFATGNVNLGDYSGIRDWPTQGENGAPLAPFVDVNNDQLYEPSKGDYPRIDGDQAIFWVINDKGDIHTETGGNQIGIEIQFTAFAFTTSDAVNDMTFYREKLINKSGTVLRETYLGQWTDADLGYAFDDYVGCDTLYGLGYVYNGDNNDERNNGGYGAQPPACGVDFFQGPLADEGDGIDNNKNGQIDEPGERISMAKFVYYNNDFTNSGNPSQATHYYQYLRGIWKNGTQMIDDRVSNNGNGNGFKDGTERDVFTNYMFPDYPGKSCAFASPRGANPWKETATPADRRFLQSAGPFTLRPGAVNELVVGVVWARDESNVLDEQQFGSVCKLFQGDRLAQALYDNSFKTVEGPDAPLMSITPLDQELVVSWNYDRFDERSSNNRYENYRQRDPALTNTGNPYYNFQGYIVYQLADDGVSLSQLDDVSKARAVFQCDLEDSISVIFNREKQNVPGLKEPIIQERIMVEGANKGITRSVRVREDLFAQGAAKSLVNYRTYYFAVVAYAYNPDADKKFIIGNRGFNRYVGMPHKTNFERNGQELRSGYGTSPEITKVTGTGSGGRILRVTNSTDLEIVDKGASGKVVYQAGSAPIDVRVVNPKATKNMKYRVEIVPEDKSQIGTFEVTDTLVDSNNVRTPIRELYAKMVDWRVLNADNPKDTIFESVYLKNITPGKPVSYVNKPHVGDPKLIVQRKEITVQGRIVTELVDHGISISVKNVLDPGSLESIEHENNGVIGGRVIFEDSTKQWMGGLPDFDQICNMNWIRSGPKQVKEKDTESDPDCIPKGYRPPGSVDPHPNPKNFFVLNNRFYDPDKRYEEVLRNRSWAPYIMSAQFHTEKGLPGPAVKIKESINPSLDELDPRGAITLDKLPNVDIIITKDQSKWSKCVVVETSPSRFQGSSSYIMTAKYRKSRGINETNYVAQKPEPNDADYGMSYFPGYAINVETGERLNIFFGEATWFKEQNGDDMLFNPTTLFNDLSQAIVLYGRHFLYVTNERYDGCEQIAKNLRVPPSYTTQTTANPMNFIQGGNNDTINIGKTYSKVAWTSIPNVQEDRYIYKSYSSIPTDVRVQLRVNKTFRQTIDNQDSLVVAAYEFEMTAKTPKTEVKEVASEALKQVKIVPNPYYGRSGGVGRYEKNQIDTRVKLTNLPQKCIIRVFTLNGTLVRTFRKDSDLPEQEWDLKNENGAPIASGTYIIHIDAGSIGEKVLKFLSIMPEQDINIF